MKFSPGFADEFVDLLRWRRDVRHFRREPLEETVFQHILDATSLAPSVGNSQPWRLVSVDAPHRRAAVRANFTAANERSLAGYEGERAELYARLKLSGLDDAPRQLAVFCADETRQGHGLGRQTMPEMLRYSVVCAVHTLWLAASALDVGVGWVSILDPVTVREQLDVPEDWALVAYLCIGRAVEDHDVPELERRRWQQRTAVCREVLAR